MQNHYLVAYLNWSKPQDVFKLLRQIGPATMNIKAGKALICYSKPEHVEQALKLYRRGASGKLNFALVPYRQGELEKPAPPPQPQTVPEPIVPPPPIIQERIIQLPAPPLSEFTTKVQKELKVKDPNDPFQVAMRQNRKQIMELAINFTPLQKALSSKLEQLKTTYPIAEEFEKKKSDFFDYFKDGLIFVKDSLRKDLKCLRKSCANYDKTPKDIELQPEVKITQIPKTIIQSNDVAGFTNIMQFTTPEPMQIKRIVALNDKQFVVTGHKRPTRKDPYSGRLMVYKLDDQFPEITLEVNQAVYSLLLMNPYIFTGTYEGQIAFFNTKNLTQKGQELSQNFFGNAINDIAAVTRADSQGCLLAIHDTRQIKIITAREEQYTETQKTMFFQENFSFNPREKEPILSLDSFDIGKIIYSGFRVIRLFDCNTRSVAYEANLTSNALRIAKINNELIAAGTEHCLSFVDIRNHARTINYDSIKGAKTVTPLSEYAIFYGSEGEIGVVDRRSPNQSYWKTNAFHKTKVYDICRVGQQMVSGDQSGLMASWMPNPKELELTQRNTIVAEVSS